MLKNVYAFTGTKFASGSKDRSLRIWDLSSEKPLNTFSLPRKLPGHKKEDMSRMKVYHSVLWLNESQVLSGYPRLVQKCIIR